MQTLTANFRDYRIIPIEDFVNLSDADRANISRVKIIAPDMDDDDFGCMKVFYKHPVYEVEMD